MLICVCFLFIFSGFLFSGESVKKRFKVPEGYVRVKAKAGSYQSYLQNFPLKPKESKVYYFNGEEKRLKVYDAVLNIDTGRKDLQQCADAIMRLRAEYLFYSGKKSEISFDFTNGFKARYSKWREGFRIKVKGNKCFWYKAGDIDDSYKSFRKYMETVFIYAGSYSLSKELKKTGSEEIKIGDVFIQGGFPGHAVIILDMAINSRGEKIMLLAQSYMPAQDIHILKNFTNSSISPWYKLMDSGELKTPEWIFDFKDVKGF